VQFATLTARDRIPASYAVRELVAAGGAPGGALYRRRGDRIAASFSASSAYDPNATWAVAKGKLEKPSVWDPILEVLVERGALHEQSYLDHLEANGLPILRIDGIGVDTHAVAQTLDAMRAGAPIIAQGALQAGRWGGRADILRRIENPSDLGACRG
jgi:hypothetical protein